MEGISGETLHPLSRSFLIPEYEPARGSGAGCMGGERAGGASLWLAGDSTFLAAAFLRSTTPPFAVAVCGCTHGSRGGSTTVFSSSHGRCSFPREPLIRAWPCSSSGGFRTPRAKKRWRRQRQMTWAQARRGGRIPPALNLHTRPAGRGKHARRSFLYCLHRFFVRRLNPREGGRVDGVGRGRKKNGASSREFNGPRASRVSACRFDYGRRRPVSPLRDVQVRHRSRHSEHG